MRAFILAAGLGTRLRPLTNETPKALISINGKPLLQKAIEHLKEQGCTEYMVNVHHFGQQIIDFLAKNQGFGLPYFISDERDELLDTGGALRRAAWFIAKGDVLIYNADIVTDLPLHALWEQHQTSEALATLAVRDRDSSRKLLFSQVNLQLCAWQGKDQVKWVSNPLHPEQTQAWAFSGIQVISPAFLSYCPPGRVFSVVDMWLRAATKEPIVGFNHTGSRWFDAGKPEALKKIEEAGL